MRKLIILKLTLSFLLLFSFCFAQGQTKQFNFGAYGGVANNNVYQLNKPTVFDNQTTPVLLGIHADYNFGDRLSSGIELEYIHKGPKFYKIDYLVLSVVAKYKVFENLNLEPVLGGYAGYLFKFIGFGREHNHPELKQYDFGVQGGVQYTIPITSWLNVFISPRVELGLYTFSFSRHRSFQLRAGIEF